MTGRFVRGFAGALVFVGTLLLGGAVLAQSDEVEPPAGPGVAYTVTIEGLGDGLEGLEERLRTTSLSLDLRESPPRSRAGLRRRAEQDVERFLKVLRAAGHYDAKVSLDLAAAGDDGTVPLSFAIELGPLYVIEQVLVERLDEGTEAPAEPALLDDLGLALGAPAQAGAIIAGQERLARLNRQRGYPFAATPSRRTTIDRSAKTMTVRYRLEAGPRAIFGAPKIEGLETVERGYASLYASWVEGAPYDIRKLEETQRKLAATGLFETVAVTPIRPQGMDAPDADGPRPVDIRIAVTERAHRSIGFGGGYSTSTGPTVSGSWEHRNLFDEGERLRATATASQVERGVETTFRKPFFRDERQALLAEGELKDTTSEAFDELRASAFVGLERRLSPVWTAVYGPTLDLIDQDVDDNDESGITLAGLRGTLRRDSTDDVLNPTDGSRLELSLSPYQDVTGAAGNFLSSAVQGARYLRIDDAGDFVVAGRARLGSIVGEKRAVIPAGKRFYAGGGGSVRGYGFQRLGPLDGDLDPIGGRSVLELGLELRTRLTETIGLVPFLEAGNVYEESLPPTDALDLRYGAGLGLRYFTDFGPIRLDVAMPIDKRDNIDDAYQIYVSLGQAF